MTPLTIRPARPDDAAALRRLADLDSQRPLTGAVLLAEDTHVPVAAIAVADGRVTADPFRPTAATVILLETRAGQLRGGTVQRNEHPRLFSADAAAFGGNP